MLGRGSFEIRMGNEQRTLKSGLRPFIISLYEGVLFMNSYFHPKWMSFPEHHKARAPLIGPHRVGIITKAMSPKRSSNLCIGYIRAPWVVGRMMSFLMGPRQSKQGWGGGVMRHRHPFKTLYKVTPLFLECSVIFSPFYFLTFLGPWALWNPQVPPCN